MYFKNVKAIRKKCIFLKQFWSFVLFSFWFWFYVFAPGSHCFAIDILYISVYIKQICDLPSPLLIDLNCSSQIFNLQKLGRQQSNCSKTGPQKIKPEEKKSEFHLPNWIVKCFFSAFFSHVYFVSLTFFPKCFFSRAHFQNAFFPHVSHFCEQMWKSAFWKCDWKNMRKKCVLKMWKKCE